jgi:hypothetical protein
MYSASAASLLVPFTEDQASHLALPLKSKKPGHSVLTSPTVAWPGGAAAEREMGKGGEQQHSERCWGLQWQHLAEGQEANEGWGKESSALPHLLVELVQSEQALIGGVAQGLALGNSSLKLCRHLEEGSKTQAMQVFGGAAAPRKGWKFHFSSTSSWPQTVLRFTRRPSPPLPGPVNLCCSHELICCSPAQLHL